MSHNANEHVGFKSISAVIMAFGLAAMAGSSEAQDISQYYTVQHPEQFELDFAHDLYMKADELTAGTRQRLPHHLDLAFGEDPKQRLDLYLPAERIDGAPVLVFLHGGGFQEGDRSHYGFVAEPYARHGIVTAVAGYRLTGAGFVYPSQADDLKSAIVWLYKNVAKYGGDPERIYLSGHSSGAMLAACVGVDLSWLEERGLPASILGGIALVSGAYDFTKMKYDHYVPTPELKVEASAINHIKNAVPKVIVAVGTVEQAYLEPSRVFNRALVAKGVDTALVELAGENHIDTVYSLATEGSPLFEAVLEMMLDGETTKKVDY